MRYGEECNQPACCTWPIDTIGASVDKKQQPPAFDLCLHQHMHAVCGQARHMIQVQEASSSTGFADICVPIYDAHSLWVIHVCLQMGKSRSRVVLYCLELTAQHGQILGLAWQIASPDLSWGSKGATGPFSPPRRGFQQTVFALGSRQRATSALHDHV